MGSYATSDDGQTPCTAALMLRSGEPKIITTAHALWVISIGPALSVASVGWVLTAFAKASPSTPRLHRRSTKKWWHNNVACLAKTLMSGASGVEAAIMRVTWSASIKAIQSLFRETLDAPETVLGITRNGPWRSHGYTTPLFGGHSDKTRWLFSHYPVRWAWIVYRAHLRKQLGGVGHRNQFYGPGSQKFSAGLDAGQGNWVTSGGEVASGSDAEFNRQLDRADDSHQEGASVTRRPCLTIMRPYQ